MQWCVIGINICFNNIVIVISWWWWQRPEKIDIAITSNNLAGERVGQNRSLAIITQKCLEYHHDHEDDDDEEEEDDSDDNDYHAHNSDDEWSVIAWLSFLSSFLTVTQRGLHLVHGGTLFFSTKCLKTEEKKIM